MECPCALFTLATTYCPDLGRLFNPTPLLLAGCMTRPQAQQEASVRISDLQSTLEVCQADADNLREMLAQAELQRREAERQAAITQAAGAHNR